MSKRKEPVVPSHNVRRDADHRYWIDDGAGHEHEAVSVTRTLIENNMVDDAFFTDASRGRGKLVHFLCEHLMLQRLGALVEVPPHVSGYLVAVRKFLDHYAPRVIGTERIRGNLPRLLAGGLDLELADFCGGPQAVVEIKTSAPAAWHGLQTAPYAYLTAGPKWLNVGRFGLYITPNGGFRLKEHDDPGDLQIFFNGLENLQWRIKRGSFERPYGRSAQNRDETGSRIVDDEATGNRIFDDEATGNGGSDPHGDLSAGLDDFIGTESDD